MAVTFPLVLDDDAELTVIEVDRRNRGQLGSALREAGIPTGVPVLVVVGGAGGMEDHDMERLRPVFAQLVQLLEDHRAAAVDGGTDTGIMRALGDARREARAHFPLLGVAARGTLALPGRVNHPDAAGPDPGHSHLVLVPGEEWGDESPWIADVATTVAATAASVTLLVNGGEIAYEDAEHSHRQGRPVVVVEGSGRTADDLAAALRQDSSAGRRARAVVAGGPVEAVSIQEPSRIIDEIRDRLRPVR